MQFFYVLEKCKAEIIKFKLFYFLQASKHSLIKHTEKNN